MKDLTSRYAPGVVTDRTVTHKLPDLDEIFCLSMAKHYGENVWPGIAKAIDAGRIDFINAGALAPGSLSANEQERTLGRPYFGCGCGDMDEHSDGGGPRKAASAADLTAEILDLASRAPKLSLLISEVSRGDSKPTNRDLGLPKVTKAVRQTLGNLGVVQWGFFALDALRFAAENPEKIQGRRTTTLQQYLSRWNEVRRLNDGFIEKMRGSIQYATKKLEYLSLVRVVEAAQLMPGGNDRLVEEWMSQTLDALWAEYRAFQKALNAPHKAHEVTLADGSKGLVVVIDGDVEMADKAMRYKYKGQMLMFAQRRKSGGVQILGLIDPKTNLPTFEMPILAGSLRDNEARARGIDTTGKDLRIQGMPEWMPIWYSEHQYLLNRSPKNPEVEPTKLSLEKILEIVLSFLATQRLEAAA